MISFDDFCKIKPLIRKYSNTDYWLVSYRGLIESIVTPVVETKEDWHLMKMNVYEYYADEQKRK